MPNVRYKKLGLTLSRGGTNDATLVSDLQRHLRALGYLKSGIDGDFGRMTDLAVRALKYDLLHNHGAGQDGAAPVSVLDYNRGRVFNIDGQVGASLAGCIEDMLNDTDFPKLPEAHDPLAENRQARALVAALPSSTVPTPFLIAIMRQESGLKHFVEPHGKDQDNFILVGFDANASDKTIITSRGYGMGQYTLFHHPPRATEVNDFMLDPVKNVQKAIRELKAKFDGFVIGPSSGTQADDRIVEAGKGPMRACTYPKTDPRYMADCKQCAIAAGVMDLTAGITPVFKGSPYTFEPTKYYAKCSYQGVPVRGKFPCDWPYAARRYNGAGINSYHYQALVLLNLLLP